MNGWTAVCRPVVLSILQGSRLQYLGEHFLLGSREILLRQLTERVDVCLVGLLEEREQMRLHKRSVLRARREDVPGDRACRQGRP